jgi:hypothetical protein
MLTSWGYPAAFPVGWASSTSPKWRSDQQIGPVEGAHPTKK